MEWSSKNKYNPMNSMKGLMFYEHYQRILLWMDGKGELPAPIEASLDPTTACNNNCLTPDTLVNTPRGFRRIDGLSVGDTVLGYNTLTQQMQEQIVVATMLTSDTLVPIVEIEIGHTRLHCTSDHPIFAQRGWLEANQLSINDEVLVLAEADEETPYYTTRERCLEFKNETQQSHAHSRSQAKGCKNKNEKAWQGIFGTNEIPASTRENTSSLTHYRTEKTS